MSDIAWAVDDEFFLGNKLNVENVATKAFVLMLAHLLPKSFISGPDVKLDEVLAAPNRKEYHHCYPRAALVPLEVADAKINALANFAIISRAENREINAKPPSEYRLLLPADVTAIRDHALLPESLFSDDCETFLAERAAHFSELAARLGA